MFWLFGRISPPQNFWAEDESDIIPLDPNCPECHGKGWTSDYNIPNKRHACTRCDYDRIQRMTNS